MNNKPEGIHSPWKMASIFVFILFFAMGTSIIEQIFLEAWNIITVMAASMDLRRGSLVPFIQAVPEFAVKDGPVKDFLILEGGADSPESIFGNNSF